MTKPENEGLRAAEGILMALLFCLALWSLVGIAWWLWS